MEDNEIIQEFPNYLKFEKHLSEQTAKCYAADLEQFCDFLISQSNQQNPGNQSNMAFEQTTGTAIAVQRQSKIEQLLLDVNADTIRSFLVYLSEDRCRKVTIGRKLAALRSFYKFLMKRGLIEANPVAMVETPRQEKKQPPRFLQPQQAQRLLSMPSTDNWLGTRDRAILEILYGCGIRVSELVGLNIEDIDFLGELIHIRSEGKKERVAPIRVSALQSVQHYFEFRNKRARNKGNFDQRALFVNRHGRRLSSRSVRRKTDKYVKMAGLDPAVSPHTLRHSFAVQLLNNGANLRQVQQLLGHRSLSSTQVYTNSAKEELKVVGNSNSSNNNVKGTNYTGDDGGGGN